MYKAEILADSLSPEGHRLTTMKITFPRIVLAEFNTHRMFSRNSASSRAIPVRKMLKMIEENCFVPIAWQKDHKGMQGTEYVTEEKDIKTLISKWLGARDEALWFAEELNDNMATKQLCNRLLEPFMWHTVIVTATEWDNFFELRCPQYLTGYKLGSPEEDQKKFYKSWKELCRSTPHVNLEAPILSKLSVNHSQADIHIQAIAELMYDAYQDSIPKRLNTGEWHIPFGDNISNDEILAALPKIGKHGLLENFALQIAVARCARISYQTLGDEPKIDYVADLKLHDILASSGHFSPFEHVARVMSDDEYIFFNKKEVEGIDSDGTHILKTENGWCRNFRGFIQYRSLID